MTWLPIGVYRTFPLPILPIPPPPPKRIFKYREAESKVANAAANTTAKIEAVTKPPIQ